MVAGKSADTAHLYEGKVMRAAAPSRKKLAGRMKAGGAEVPDDAVPKVHIPTFVAVSYTHLTLPTICSV